VTFLSGCVPCFSYGLRERVLVSMVKHHLRFSGQLYFSEVEDAPTGERMKTQAFTGLNVSVDGCFVCVS
jgi:hypothetical protein